MTHWTHLHERLYIMADKPQALYVTNAKTVEYMADADHDTMFDALVNDLVGELCEDIGFSPRLLQHRELAAVVAIEKLLQRIVNADDALRLAGAIHHAVKSPEHRDRENMPHLFAPCNPAADDH